MLTRNSLWSVAGGAVPALAAIVSIPVLIASLGLNLFAITSLLISITIFFYIYDFGMSRTMTYLLSAAEGHESTKDLIATALVGAFILGLLVSGVVYFATPYFAKYWMKIEVSWLNQATLAFQISALGIIPSVLANTFKGVLEGRSKFKEANLCKIFSGASIFIAPVVIVFFECKNLIYLSGAIVLTRYLSLFLFIYVAKLPKIKDVKIKKSYLFSIYDYGVWAALSGLISTLFVYGDRFFVAGYINSQDLSAYIASQDVLIRYLLIPWSMAVVLMPTFSNSNKNISKIDVVSIYRVQQKRVSHISFIILLAVLIFALFLSQFLSTTLLPKNINIVTSIQIVGVFFCAMSQLPLIYLYGKGLPKLITQLYLVELFVYIALAPLIFSYFGLVGACVVWSGRLVIEYYLLSYYAERVMKCN